MLRMDSHLNTRRTRRLLLLPLAALLALLPAMRAGAQDDEHAKPAASLPGPAVVAELPAEDQPDPQVPGLLSRWTDGFNAGFTFAGLHDS